VTDYHNYPLSFRDHKATMVARTLSSRNFPTDTVRELLKPSQEAATLLGLIFKNRSLLGLNFFGVTS